jgi:hypothetical protein
MKIPFKDCNMCRTSLTTNIKDSKVMGKNLLIHISIIFNCISVFYTIILLEYGLLLELEKI